MRDDDGRQLVEVSLEGERGGGVAELCCVGLQSVNGGGEAQRHIHSDIEVSTGCAQTVACFVIHSIDNLNIEQPVHCTAKHT